MSGYIESMGSIAVNPFLYLSINPFNYIRSD